MTGASLAQALAQARGSEDAHNTRKKRKHKQNKRFCTSCAWAQVYVNPESAAVSTPLAVMSEGRHLVLHYRAGMEPNKGNYQICACLCAYAYVKGVLTSVMPMLMLVTSYKKSKLRRSALVRISNVSEYLLPSD